MMADAWSPWSDLRGWLGVKTNDWLSVFDTVGHSSIQFVSFPSSLNCLFLRVVLSWGILTSAECSSPVALRLHAVRQNTVSVTVCLHSLWPLIIIMFVLLAVFLLKRLVVVDFESFYLSALPSKIWNVHVCIICFLTECSKCLFVCESSSVSMCMRKIRFGECFRDDRRIWYCAGLDFLCFAPSRFVRGDWCG